MRTTLRRRGRLPALLLAFALVAAACGDNGDDTPEPDPGEGVEEPEPEPEPDEDDNGDDDGEEAAPAQGGTVLFGDEQEPAILNSFLIDGNSLVTSKVTANVFPGMYRVRPDFSFEPYLLDGEAEFTEDPFSVTYRIREDAVWSDDTPITSDDVIFTYETIVSEDEDIAAQITSTAGYDLITEVDQEDDKTVTFTFSEPYAPWQLLFGAILPAHVLDGEDFLTVMNDSLPEVSGGPFIFDEWQQGTQLRLVRNDNFWFEDVSLDEIIIRYLPDTTTLTQQMLGAEIDMYDPQPQITLVEQLEGATDRIEFEVGLGPVWEHIDFNTLVDGLDLVHVRQAIALGINREEIVEALVRPVDPEAVVLQNPFWMANTEQYEEFYDQWDFDPDAAVSLLEENGCERGDDNIFECDGTRLSFRFGTTGGNERRELTQAIVQQNLADVGIEINIENDDGAAFFERLNTPDNCDGICDYDIALFAWVGSPNPVGNANIYGCDDGEPRAQNWTVWCNDEITQVMDEANSTVDPDVNADLWNQAAEIIASEVPIIPLFQQPQLLAFSNDISGPQLNATNATQFWNSGEWSRTQ